MILALAIAAVGGWLAELAGLPLPWMLGAIGATTIAALAKAPVATPTPIMPPMRVVLGVLMGSSVTPDMLQHASTLGLSLALVPLYVLVASALGWVYLAALCRMEKTEAYFAALPGGLYTMVTFAEELGINVKRIALNHTLRVMLIVIVLPLIVQALLGEDVIRGALASSSLATISLIDLAILTASGLVGWAVSERLKIPGGIMIVPMFFTAVLELTGVTSAKPPIELVIAAQVVLGAGIGGRFIGFSLTEIGSAVVHAGGYVLIMLGLTSLTAWGLAGIAGVNMWSSVLAFAPGGLAEMSLIALALGLNVGLIATVHTVRILLVVTAAPLIFKWIQPRLESA
ncbi:MAG: AbrB family transcriptional regulator [Pseudomonadota bacterium]